MPNAYLDRDIWLHIRDPKFLIPDGWEPLAVNDIMRKSHRWVQDGRIGTAVGGIRIGESVIQWLANRGRLAGQLRFWPCRRARTVPLVADDFEEYIAADRPAAYRAVGARVLRVEPPRHDRPIVALAPAPEQQYPGWYRVTDPRYKAKRGDAMCSADRPSPDHPLDLVYGFAGWTAERISLDYKKRVWLFSKTPQRPLDIYAPSPFRHPRNRIFSRPLPLP